MSNAHGKSPHTTVSVSLFYTDGQSFNDNEPETIGKISFFTRATLC